MNIHINIPEKLDIDNFILQKMSFIYNALEDGWDIKKIDNKYIFSKNHEEKKEVYLDSYLQHFLESNISIKKLTKI